MLPCLHAVDARGILVHASDEAWDRNRIVEETQALHALRAQALATEDGQARQAQIQEEYGQHPVARYLAGETRYDLDAPMRLATPAGPREVRVSDYWLSEPTKISLRRIPRQEWAEVSRNLAGRLSSVVAVRINLTPEEAAQISYVDAVLRQSAIEAACRYGVQAIGDRQLSGTEADLDWIHALGPNLVQDLGLAAIRYSQPLRDAEAFLFA